MTTGVNDVVSCNEFVKELGDLLDKEVTTELHQQLEFHLVQCHSCRTLYDSTCKTLSIVAESRSFEFPEPVPEPFVNKVMAWIRCNGNALEK